MKIKRDAPEVHLKGIPCKYCGDDVQVSENLATAVCAKCGNENLRIRELPEEISNYESLLTRLTQGSDTYRAIESRVKIKKKELARLSAIAATRRS